MHELLIGFLGVTLGLRSLWQVHRASEVDEPRWVLDPEGTSVAVLCGLLDLGSDLDTVMGDRGGSHSCGRGVEEDGRGCYGLPPRAARCSALKCRFVLIAEHKSV